MNPTSPNIGRSSQLCSFVSEFGYLVALSNAGGSKLSDVEDDANFALSDPCEN